MSPSVQNDTLLQELCAELSSRHAAHTILLYGSRANGSAGPDSDYDIAAFAPVAATLRDARLHRGAYLDIFIYPESVLSQADASYLQLRNSLVLRQRGEEASRFLALQDELHQAGPEPLPEDERAARIAWAGKMLTRMRRGDPEGDYRRVWLLMALLEDYFALRGLWFEGPKKALRSLERHDPAAHRAFALALKPGADDDAIQRLAAQVTAIA